jgi:hypothetical protein
MFAMIGAYFGWFYYVVEGKVTSEYSIFVRVTATWMGIDWV